jgi:hypothetical protein
MGHDQSTYRNSLPFNKTWQKSTRPEWSASLTARRAVDFARSMNAAASSKSSYSGRRAVARRYGRMIRSRWPAEPAVSLSMRAAKD